MYQFNFHFKKNNEIRVYKISNIRYFSVEDSGISLHEAYGYGLGLVMCSVIYCFVHHGYFFEIIHTGMKVRVAHCSLIYRKALKLSRKAQGESSIGMIINARVVNLDNLNLLKSW